jgi:serine/threonine protein kinase
MQSYQYQYGDKPLDGYTIQRAVGRGGFGEVYYAVSDAGREVALKEVQAWEQIELRGIQQCMNLKNPHLVTIFDVKRSEKGKPFVIMEYVSGPSLADIVAESPNGLGTAKTAFFIKEICKGLSYLHDSGIVHRDLKPSNIFYDNGVVKIGDYGLSKSINTSRYSNQTITVGTVHYMAPEVGAGKYDRSIDIYAMGVMCYEMLTGKVPYAGESPAEVLMKHLNSQPDLTGIDPAFARVITKAMNRNPDDRYHTVNEIVEDLFGSQEVVQSMSQFNPQDLSVYAARTAETMQQAQEGNPQGSKQDVFRQRVDAASQRFEAAGKRFEAAGKLISDRFDSLNDAEYKQLAAGDTLSKKQRIILALILSGIISVAVGLFSGNREDAIVGISVLTLTMICGGGGGILLARKKLLRGMEPNIIRNWATAAFGILGAGLLSFASWQDASDYEKLARGTFFSLAVLGLGDFWKMTEFYRKKRVNIIPAFLLGVPAIVISLIFRGQPLVSFAVVCGICLFVQILWPFLGPAAEKPQTAGNMPGQQARPKPVQPAAAVNYTPPKMKYSVGVNASDISPFKRVWALIFSAGFLMGFAGLQRFYVGKIGTGILWLFTGGLLGIGQLIDFIMIISGNFRDRQGKRLLVWESETPTYTAYNAGTGMSPARPVSPTPAAAAQPQPAAQPAAMPQTPAYAPSVARQSTTVIIKDPSSEGSIFYGFCAFFGYLFLLLGMIVLLLGSLHIPNIIFSTMGPNMSNDMQSTLGTPNWRTLFEQMIVLVGYGLLLVSLIVLIFARRRHGVFHILRAVIGIGFLVLSVFACNKYNLHNYNVAVAEQNRVVNLPGNFSASPVGILIEQLNRATLNSDMAVVLFFLIAGIVFLAWPPKRIPPRIVTLNPDGSNQILTTEM